MSNFEFLTHFKTVVVDVLNRFPIFEPLINQSLIYRTRRTIYINFCFRNIRGAVKVLAGVHNNHVRMIATLPEIWGKMAVQERMM